MASAGVFEGVRITMTMHKGEKKSLNHSQNSRTTSLKKAIRFIMCNILKRQKGGYNTTD